LKENCLAAGRGGGGGAAQPGDLQCAKATLIDTEGCEQIMPVPSLFPRAMSYDC